MPEKIVNIHQAKTHLSRLLEEVRAGQEIVLAKGNTPYARLVPYLAEKPKQRELGFMQGPKATDTFFDALPETELDAWENNFF